MLLVLLLCVLVVVYFFFLMIRRPPRSTRTDTPFPTRRSSDLFAMAQQDVRYYLNGLLFDLREDTLRCVATDGHRLALCEAAYEGNTQAKRQIIVPRKGVTELQRLLEGGERELELEMGRGPIRVKRDDVTFPRKLIDGRFPDRSEERRGGKEGVC